MSSTLPTLEELAERSAARSEKLSELAKNQELLDAIAKDELEEQLGKSNIAILRTGRYVSGQPLIAIVKTPSPDQYKRFVDQVRKANSDLTLVGRAQDLLAQSVWVYPKEKIARDSMLEAFPGILPSIVIAASKMTELRSESEGKE
jgi:hypothetical protein